VELPGLDRMVGELGIEPAVAFYISRKLSTSLSKQGALSVTAFQLPQDSFPLADLYTTFWDLGLSNVVVPEAEYAAEISRVKARMDAVGKNPAVEISAAKSDAANKKRLEQIKQLKATSDNLALELEAQKLLVNQVQVRFDAECKTWFSSGPGLEGLLCQVCLLPRVLFSQEDALYSFVFITRLAKFGPPGFNLEHCIDVLVSCMLKAVFGATQREAANMAVFFQHLFALLWQWRGDKVCNSGNHLHTDLLAFGEQRLCSRRTRRR